MDETSFQRRHEYVTVVSDLEQPRVLYVADGRGQEALEAFYKGLNPGQIEAIEAVAMDMWKPYIQATQAHLPGWEEKVCFDRFHVAKHLGEAVNDVRKAEHRALLAEGDDRLKRTRYLWLMGEDELARLSRERRSQFDELETSTLRVARAWAIKETARGLWGRVQRRRRGARDPVTARPVRCGRGRRILAARAAAHALDVPRPRVLGRRIVLVVRRCRWFGARRSVMRPGGRGRSAAQPEHEGEREVRDPRAGSEHGPASPVRGRAHRQPAAGGRVRDESRRPPPATMVPHGASGS